MALIPSYVKNKFTADEIESFGNLTAPEITVTEVNVTTVNVTTLNATTVNATTVTTDNITVTDTLTVVTINATGDITTTGDISGDNITGNTVTADAFVGGTFAGTTIQGTDITSDSITVDDITSETIVTDTITVVTSFESPIISTDNLKFNGINGNDVINKRYTLTIEAVTLKDVSWDGESASYIDGVPLGYMAVLNSAFFYYRAGDTPFTAAGSSIRIAVRYPDGDFGAILTTLGAAFDGSSVLNQTTNRMVSLATPTIYSGIINPTTALSNLPWNIGIYNEGTVFGAGNGSLIVDLDITYYPLSNA